MNRRDAIASLGAAIVAALWCRPSLGNEVDFQTWLKDLQAEAVQKGLPRRVIDEALTDVAPIPRILELDRKQPEVTLTFEEYIARVVTPKRAETARARQIEHRELLQRVSERFGVQPRFILALWAIETDFGRISGNFPVITALATLAYDGRRSAFFREELFKALQIVARGHITVREMRGSWAGAMGQCQFMPSTYLSYAVDFDGDERADIWSSYADVFASAANYLSQMGWRGDETWGRAVRLPADFDPSLVDYNKVQKPLTEWRALGVRRADGGEIPAPRDMTGSIIQPGGPSGPSFLIYNNYRVLLRWNRSLYFATAVGFLADRIADG